MPGGSIQEQQAKEPKQRRLAQFLVEQEYSNLGTALRLALEQEGTLESYRVLSQHLDALQDHRRGLELGQMVLHVLESLPETKLLIWRRF